MQVLFKRSQSEGAGGRVTFDLWAKFEVTEEEQELLTRYKATNAVLSEGNRWRDLRRAMLAGGALGILAFYVAGSSPKITATTALLIGALVAAVLTYVVYQQIREEIRVSDILTGRTFACRSVLTLMEKEQTVTQMAVAFRRFLEAMKTWGGAEVIDIAPEREPTVRRIEEPHRAAA